MRRRGMRPGVNDGGRDKICLLLLLQLPPPALGGSRGIVIGGVVVELREFPVNGGRR